MRRKPDLVRYVSPFGSPAWMPRERAEQYLKEDDKLWLTLQECEKAGAGPLLTSRMRDIGPPRIEAHT